MLRPNMVLGVQDDVIDIDLEPIIDAIEWFGDLDEMQGKKVALHGVSRGAELALILATLPQAPKPDAVAVHAATDRIAGGNWDTYGGHIPEDIGARAWRWQGQYLPMGGKFEIERFDGKLFLSHGIEDEVWPVSFSKALELRRLEAGQPVEAFYLAGEKHVLSATGAYTQLERLVDLLDRALC